jgi:hypothetical protein
MHEIAEFRRHCEAEKARCGSGEIMIAGARVLLPCYCNRCP